ncbi:MAG: 3-isopropylmalate dehydratase [Pseudomonadota bacterium]
MMGKAFLLGDDIDTGQLAPGHLLKLGEDELATHCLETLRPDFASQAKPGDFVVAGKNFGQGSSREQAAISLKVLGISAIFANSFARIFFRNAINIGLPVFELEQTHSITEGDDLAFDLPTGRLENLSSGEKYQLQVLPDYLMQIVSAGGLVPLLEREMARRQDALIGQ